MKEQYKRIELSITVFDQEDIITTSTTTPEDSIRVIHEGNNYRRGGGDIEFNFD